MQNVKNRENCKQGGRSMFPFLVLLARISSMNKSDERGHPYLVPNFGGWGLVSHY